MKININIMKKKENAVLPEKKTRGSAGFDLYACLPNKEVVINPGKIIMIPTGIAIMMPKGEYTAFIFARSGLSSKFGISLANGVGVVDNDYRGEIIIPLYNSSETDYKVEDGDRIAQLIVMAACDLEINETNSLDKTDRNESGFGSTGR